MSKKWARLLLIAVFVVLAVFGLRQVQAQEARFGLGVGVLGTSGKSQELTLVLNDWYFQAARIGGEGELPDQFARFSTGFRVDWRDETELSPFLRFGMAYFDAEPLGHVGDRWAYDMAVGIRFLRVVELEWQHNSTAGRTPVNSGVDLISLGLVKEF